MACFGRADAVLDVERFGDASGVLHTVAVSEVKDVDALTAASALDATLREPPVNKTVYLPPLATDPGSGTRGGGAWTPAVAVQKS